MPDKAIAIDRARRDGSRPPIRPTMLAIAGDSAAGKTTLTRGLLEALGPKLITAVCVDDYHRFDREERRSLPFTPLHPDCNHIEIMEQHLQLLARGEAILKPVYDHANGTLGRPELVEPRPFVIVEGLLPLHTKLMRACFDVTVYVDPPEALRRRWKVQRDCAERCYAVEEVLAELDRRQGESEAYIRSQRAHADIVVRFAPIEQRGETLDDPLSGLILLRPTINHPDLRHVLTDDVRSALHLKLLRDDDGKPVDAIHIHAYAKRHLTADVEQAIWSCLGVPDRLPPFLGLIGPGRREEPLALTQLILLYHLRAAQKSRLPKTGPAELGRPRTAFSRV
jgi:phosphoribulokinase